MTEGEHCRVRTELGFGVFGKSIKDKTVWFIEYLGVAVCGRVEQAQVLAGPDLLAANLDVLDRAAPMWLDAGDNGQQVTVREVPTREQIEIPVREQLIVELYSK